MKSVCSLVFATIMIFLISQAQGADWVSIDKNQGVETFYNRESVAELPSGVIRVWVKWELSDAGRINVANFWDVLPGACDEGRPDMLSYMLLLHEVKCLEKEQRIVTCSLQSADGQTICPPTSEPSERWEPIDTDSYGERLYKAVCPPQEKK